MKFFRIISATFLCLLSIVFAVAQSSFTTKLSAAKIGKNELLQVNYEVQNGDIENFIPPSFTGWQVLSGPNTESSTLINNGQKTTRIVYQYILKPLSTGTFLIPGAKAIVEGKPVTSNSANVTVDSHNATTPPPQQNYRSNLNSLLGPGGMDDFFSEQQRPQDSYDGYLLTEGEKVEDKIKKNLFVQVNVNKKSCYEGESIVATYLLYSRVNLNARITKLPSFSGFSSVDIANTSNSEFETVNYDGKVYRVYTIRKVQLYPLQAGQQTLNPVEIESEIQFRKVPSLKNMQNYDPYSPDNYVNVHYTVRSDLVSITVDPLPADNKPVDFKGVVGNFEIKSSLQQNELALNQAGKLHVEISGSGNWAMVQPPAINWPNGLEVYEPAITENLDSQAIPVSGKKIYEYSFSNNKPGTLQIPAIGFSFFDPLKKEYESISTQPLQQLVLNKTIASAQPDYTESQDIDLTQVFTDTVKVVFPLAAIGLLLWLFVRTRRRKRHMQNFGYPDRWQYDEMIRKNWQAEPFKQTLSNETKAGTENTITTSNTFNEPVTITGTSYVAEHIVPINEPLIIPSYTSSKEYFIVVKKGLFDTLRIHWKITDYSTPGIQKTLHEKGILLEDAESLALLLEACNKYIYSPFAENIDKHEWDKIVNEIQALLKRN